MEITQSELAVRYSNLSDDELVDMLIVGYLSTEALRILETELSKRNIDFKIIESLHELSDSELKHHVNQATASNTLILNELHRKVIG